MKRFVCDLSTSDLRHVSSAGYTLVEMLVALLLISMLLVPVIVLFGNVSESVSESRSMIESAEQLRLAATRLQQDLAGATVTMLPPRKPEDNEGYFEYIEGPITAATAVNVAMNTDVTPMVADSTVGDFDDILLFTTRSTGRPFVGRYYNPSTGTVEAIKSDIAEVAWFLRGRTLHRRVLLIAPSLPLDIPAGRSFYDVNDISACNLGTLVANTLGNLTRRECRFAHPTAGFPYDVRNWTWQGLTSAGGTMTFPTIPTLNECSNSGWAVNQASSNMGLLPNGNLDLWTNRTGSQAAYFVTGTRVADDVILNNVIGFDVKAWDPHAVIRVDDGSGNITLLCPGDPGYQNGFNNLDTGGGPPTYTSTNIGTYVDIGYGNQTYALTPTAARNGFGHLGHTYSSLAAAINQARTYDTFSTSHFSAKGSNGLDDNGNGVVDENDEKWLDLDMPLADRAPPYPVPLRGIQVKIRIFEPESRQVREVTVVQDFLPQ